MALTDEEVGLTAAAPVPVLTDADVGLEAPVSPLTVDEQKFLNPVSSIATDLFGADPAGTVNTVAQAVDQASPLSVIEQGADALGLGSIFNETFRTIGGGTRDAVQGVVNLPSDVLNSFDATSGALDRPPQLPAIEQPKHITNQVARPLVQFGEGFAGGAGLVRGMPQLANLSPRLQAAIGGMLGDVAVSSPEDPNLSNIIVDNLPEGSVLRSAIGGLAKDTDDSPLINRGRDAFEGLFLGELAGEAIEAFTRLAGKVRKAPAEVTAQDIDEAAATGDEDAIAILRATGATDEQIAAMSPGFRQRAAETVEARRADEAGRVDIERAVGEIPARDIARAAREGRAGSGPLRPEERAAAEADIAVERIRTAQDTVDQTRAEREAFDTAGGTPEDAAQLALREQEAAALERPRPPNVIEAGRATEKGFEATPGRRSDDPGLEAGRSAVVVDDAARTRIQERFGFVPESLQQQRAMVRVLDEADGRQAAADEAGVFRTSEDTSEAVGPSSPRSAPLNRPNRQKPTDAELDTGTIRRGTVDSGTSDRPFRATATDDASAQPTGPREEGLEGLRSAGVKDPQERDIPRAKRDAPQPTRENTATGEREPLATKGDEFEEARVQDAEAARKASVEDLEREWARRAEAREQARRQREAGDRRRRPDDDPFFKARDQYRGKSRAGSFSNQAKARGGDGRFETDEFGFVRSTKEGPIKFADQKQAARWVVNKGHKESPDQVFEIENHPSGDGFTVRERGRSKTDDTGEGAKADSDAGSADSSSARGEGDAKPGDGEAADAGSASSDEAGPAGLIEDGSSKGDKANPDGTKLYSNPLDPDLIGQAARDLFGYSAKAAQSLKSRLMDTTSFTGKALDVLGTMARWTIYTADGRIRSVARRFGSKTAMKVADTFFAEAGDTSGVARSYDEAVSLRQNERQNEVARMLEPFAGDDAAMKQLAAMVRNPKSARKGTKMGDAAHAMIQFFRDELKYLRDAGVEVGNVVNGYLPRMVDDALVQADPQGFIKAATEVFVTRMRIPRAEAREAASAWADRILGVKAEVDGDFNAVPSATVPSFTKGRKLPEGVDRTGPLAKWYISDPQELMGAYVAQGTRRAEWTRRMGPKLEKWADMKRGMLDEGVPMAGVQEIYNAIEAAVGRRAVGLSPKGREWLGWARLWNTVGLLEKATLSSLQEVAMPAIRSGDPRVLLTSLGRTVADLTAWLTKSGSAIERREFAEDFGLIAANGFTTMMNVRTAGGAPASKSQAKILDKYFRRTGLEQLTRATRVASVDHARVFIRRLVRDHEAGRKLAKKFLGELGVKESEIDDLAKFLREGDGMPTRDQVREGGKAGEAYITAVGRFMDQSVMRPSGSTRPTWASHPVGSLVFQLQAFLYAFQKNAVNRSGRLAFAAMTNRDLAKGGKFSEDGLTVGDRLQLAAPAAMMTVLPVLSYYIGEVRDGLLGDPHRKRTETDLDKVIKAISRSGLTGVLDPYVNMFTGVKYNRSVAQSMTGPLIGRATDTIDTVIRTGVRNSENTNTQERALAKGVYDMIIEPSLNVALTNFNPLAGAAATQAAGSGWTREQFIEFLAGPPSSGKSKRRGNRGSTR